MEKILTIDSRQVKFKSTGGFLLRYKMQFGRDAIGDLLKLEKAVSKIKESEKKKGKRKEIDAKVFDALDLTIFFNLIWVLAKTAEPKILPPMDWLDTFDEFPIWDIIPELEDMLMSTIKSSVKVKN